MWQRSVHAELWKYLPGRKTSSGASDGLQRGQETPAATIETSKGYVKRVSRQVAVTAEEAAGALPEIGNDYDVGLVVAGAGFQPCFPLAHVVGSAQICVPVTPTDLQSSEFVYQKEVDHAGNSVGAVHSRGAILQDVDVIDHREGNQVNVHASAEPDGVQRTKGDAFSVHQHQGFLSQQAAQVELDSAVAAIGDV